MNEEFYDTRIAPLLFQAGELCKEQGIPFAACVEIGPDNIGFTLAGGKPCSLAFKFVVWAIGCKGNLDSFVIKVLREVKDTSASMVANLLNNKI